MSPVHQLRAATRSAAQPLVELGQRPHLVIAVATVLYGAVLALRLSHGGPAEAYSMLYVFPVALIATSFGMRAGAEAGLLAVGLIVFWSALTHPHLSALGWASRIVPLLLLGVLLGEASDRIRRTEQQLAEAAAAAMMHREAIEINDSLVQGMAVAKWSLEAGDVDGALRQLAETMTRAQQLVSSLIRQADMGTQSENLHR